MRGEERTRPSKLRQFVTTAVPQRQQTFNKNVGTNIERTNGTVADEIVFIELCFSVLPVDFTCKRRRASPGYRNENSFGLVFKGEISSPIEPILSRHILRRFSSSVIS